MLFLCMLRLTNKVVNRHKQIWSIPTSTTQLQFFRLRVCHYMVFTVENKKLVVIVLALGLRVPNGLQRHVSFFKVQVYILELLMSNWDRQTKAKFGMKEREREREKKKEKERDNTIIITTSGAKKYVVFTTYSCSLVVVNIKPKSSCWIWEKKYLILFNVHFVITNKTRKCTKLCQTATQKICSS